MFLILFISNIFTLLVANRFNWHNDTYLLTQKNNKLQISSESEDIIVSFNQSSFNSLVKNRFEYYGGYIKTEWNNDFESTSGFAGVMQSEVNKSLFKMEFPEARIENDEIIEIQMNYATAQIKAVNSSWSLNGYKGATDGSVAVLDTGVNSTQPFLDGKIIGWHNFVNSDPISDDNGHGTFISSVIAGTGKEPYNSSNPTVVNLHGVYSHLDLFENGITSTFYSFKIFSFNASKLNSNIYINSIWDLNNSGISEFWFELYYNETLVNSSHNINPNQLYIIDQDVSQFGTGVYDLYIKYLRDSTNLNPNFSFNASVSYFPESYTIDFAHFTGTANATKIVAYKILNQSGVGFTSNLISALANVVQNRVSYKIISVCLSIGTFGSEVETINRIIDEVIKKGILVVIAAGNNGIKGSDALNGLAKNKNAIIVGAINDKDQVTSYSSMGRLGGDDVLKPDVVAPGGSKLPNSRTIISADSKSNSVTTNYGTSISAAIVSAAINLLIEAKWGNWNQWNNLNLTKWVKIIKSILLMTASETNLKREDDPLTDTIDESESDYSPSISWNPLINGLKDPHEGYGKLNIQSAVDALTKYMGSNIESGYLTSSAEDPLGTHVFARRIILTPNVQYKFNLTEDQEESNFDLYLFSNESTRFGEPILYQSSRKGRYRDFDYFYFTPKKNQTECIVIAKAINGTGSFTLNVSTVENLYVPELKIPEINYVGGSKNSTIISRQELLGNSPSKNYSIDQYLFYIDYYDNDSSNVPPQEVYVSIIELSKNYTLNQLDFTDNNYTDGALFVSNYFQFPNPGVFHYFFIGSDGKHRIRFPETETFNITIEFPTDSVSIPYNHSFNDGMGNWSVSATGWDLLNQTNFNDNRSKIYNNSWNSLYFGVFHNNPSNYTYQPVNVIDDPYPNGTLFSPLFNLTQLNENTTQPFARFGIRSSINSGDYMRLQINLNWTGWITLKVYTNQEREWFLEEINLTEYIGYFVQFRFQAELDNNFDTTNYKGFFLDYFSISNYTNENSPLLIFNLTRDISSFQGSKFQKFEFTCIYYDLDNNYPNYLYLEMDNENYTMVNIFGDWISNSNSTTDKGITFEKSLLLGEISNHSFRFHYSDGKFQNETQWYNKENSLFEFVNIDPLQFNLNYTNKLIGRQFSNNNLEDYYVFGTPYPKDYTAWFRGDNTWHPIMLSNKEYLYGGIGLSYISDEQGYGTNWNAELITRPLLLGSLYNVYLEFDYEISLENEAEDSRDECIISISNDFGNSWTVLKEYNVDSEDLYGSEKLDISQYSDQAIMIRFALHSNNNVPLSIYNLGQGWLLSNIYIGYDKSTDFIDPKIQILSPKNDEVVDSITMIRANITDNLELDSSKIYIYLREKSVERQKLNFNSTTGILEFKWDTTKYNDGIYQIKVIAYDKEGNRAEEIIVVEIDNGIIDWNKWGFLIVLIIVVIVVASLIFIFSEKRGKIWMEKRRDSRVESIRLKDIDKDKALKRIELIDTEEELKRPLTLYCKSCRSWFYSTNFDIICPICERDQIYVAYLCENCGKWYWKGEPKENYYCKNKGCEGLRLIRREKEEVQEILAGKGILLRKFEKKKGKFSILDL